MKWIEGSPPEVVEGMLVQLRDGTVVLAGEINVLGGVCDDCMIDFHFPACIVRYVVVIEQQEISMARQESWYLADVDAQAFMLDHAAWEAERENDRVDLARRGRIGRPRTFVPEGHDLPPATPGPLEIHPARKPT